MQINEMEELENTAMANLEELAVDDLMPIEVGRLVLNDPDAGVNQGLEQCTLRG